MLPLNYDTPVLDEFGKVHPLNEYAGGGGGGDISDAIPVFTSDDTIQNPIEKVSMPLFQSGNALKDLLRWISKAMQNIRYLLKFTEDISTDLNTTIEQVEDINTNLVKEWTDISVARAGEYYWYNNLIWKALVDTANTPAEGSEWHNVKVMDEVRELNSKLNWKYLGEVEISNSDADWSRSLTIPQNANSVFIFGWANAVQYVLTIEKPMIDGLLPLNSSGYYSLYGGYWYHYTSKGGRIVVYYNPSTHLIKLARFDNASAEASAKMYVYYR